MNLTPVTSAAFNIDTLLSFTTQPATSAPAATMSNVVVSVVDGSTAVVTGFTGNVTLAIGTNGGSPAGTLTGTLTKACVAGVATFSDLKIDNAGTGYTLVASATGLTDATSSTFNIASATLIVTQTEKLPDVWTRFNMDGTIDSTYASLALALAGATVTGTGTIVGSGSHSNTVNSTTPSVFYDLLLNGGPETFDIQKDGGPLIVFASSVGLTSGMVSAIVCNDDIVFALGVNSYFGITFSLEQALFAKVYDAALNLTADISAIFNTNYGIDYFSAEALHNAVVAPGNGSQNIWLITA